jgi:hypothetical protein
MAVVTDIYPDCPIHFLAKRAFRFGRVKRPELMEAFGLSRASANRVFSSGQEYYMAVLRKKGHTLQPVPNVAVPAEAGEHALIDYLDARKTSFAEIGLRDTELFLSYPRWLAQLPVRPGIFLEITRALANKYPLELQYCGLRPGELARWREVLPVGLEQLGEQWRLLARDLEKANFPLRVFVLARIADIAPATPKLPRACPRHPPVDLLEPYRVELNPQLTHDQREAIANELQLANGLVKLPARSVFEFKRKFVHTGQSESGIWPLASSVEKV